MASKIDDEETVMGQLAQLLARKRLTEAELIALRIWVDDMPELASPRETWRWLNERPDR